MREPAAASKREFASNARRGRGGGHAPMALDRPSDSSSSRTSQHSHDHGVGRRDPGAPAVVDRRRQRSSSGSCYRRCLLLWRSSRPDPRRSCVPVTAGERTAESNVFLTQTASHTFTARANTRPWSGDRVFIERVILSRRSSLDQWLVTPETATARSALESCRGRAKRVAVAFMRGRSDGRLGTSPLASVIRLQRRAAAGHGPDHGSPEPVRRRTTFAHPVSSSVDPVRIERRT